MTCYVANDHVLQIQEFFNILNKFGMNLNPTKCTFGVASGEFLGYLMTKRGIKETPKQISALVDNFPPRSIKEVQRVTGKIAALNRFISRLTDRCLPFYKILKGNKKFEWKEECDSNTQKTQSLHKRASHPLETSQQRSPVPICRDLRTCGQRGICPRRK